MGNPEKGDDAAGPLCAELIKSRLDSCLPQHVRIINAGIMPENYTGDIRKSRASHVLIIDAVIAGKKPGSIFIVDPKKIIDEDVSTHRMPLSMLVKFLIENIGTKVLILGIEPGIVDLDTPISKIIIKSVNYLADQISLLLKK